MKTIKFLAGTLFSVVLFAGTVSAGENNESKSKENVSHNVIRDQMLYTFSDVTVESNTDVYILFSVDKENGFKVKEVSSLDEKVASTVKNKLEKSRIVAPASLNGDYLIKIRFLTDGTADNKISDNDVLRSLLKENLASAELPYNGSVNVKFSIKDNSISLKSVDGADEKLVKAVEHMLSNSKIETPSGISGNYQVKVTF